jgi:hypothetical protein
MTTPGISASQEIFRSGAVHNNAGNLRASHKIFRRYLGQELYITTPGISERPRR